MILAMDVKIDSDEEEVIETEFKEKHTAEYIDSKKDDPKLNALMEKMPRDGREKFWFGGQK